MYISCCCCFCSAQTSHTTICLLQVSAFPQADAQGCIEIWSRRYGQNISFRFAMECSERANEEADQVHRISPGTVCVTCETKSQRCLFFYKYKKCVTYNDLFLTLTKRYCPNLKNCEAMLTMWQRSDVIHYVSFLRSHWQSTYSFV